MDTVPYMRAAGIQYPSDGRSTDECVQPDLQPYHQNAALEHSNNKSINSTLTDKYRPSYQTSPGIRLIHPALSPDLNQTNNPSKLRPSGVATRDSLRAQEVMHGNDATGTDSLASFLTEHSESHYRTHIYAPVGRSYQRGHSLPNGEHAFGVHSQSSESAKSLIYESASVMSPTDQHQPFSNLDRTTEQQVTKPLRRGYDWDAAKVDPNQHRFGAARPAKDTGHSLQCEEKETVIVNERVLHHQIVSEAPLGHAKPVRGEKLLKLIDDPSYAFGKASDSDGVTAQQCLRGSYTEEEQLPEPDLGRSRRKLGGTSLEHNVDRDRVFGVPSVRTDRPPPQNSSLSSKGNYGVEGTAASLLNPSPFAINGVNDEDFLVQRDPKFIRNIFARMGVSFKDHQFQRLCDSAVKLYGSLSMDSFRHAYNRTLMENRCDVCGACQCQHEDCLSRPCKHDGEDGMGNHRPFLTHQPVIKPLNPPAMTGFLRARTPV